MVWVLRRIFRPQLNISKSQQQGWNVEPCLLQFSPFFSFNFQDFSNIFIHSFFRYNLAILAENGEGLEKNIDMAFQYCKLSAELGFLRSQTKLGVMFTISFV